MLNKTPNIFLAGDLHGHTAFLKKVVKTQKPDAVILLGDIDATAPLEDLFSDIIGLTEVFWIPGNHDTDTYSFYQNSFCSALADRNIHGKVVNIGGVKVAGLGGVFRQKIWHPDETPTHNSYEDFVAVTRSRRPDRLKETTSVDERTHRSSIFPDVFNKLQAQCADVLVTHEAPGYHKLGFNALDDLAHSLRVSKLFHGHHHETVSYGKGRGYHGYGVGHAEIMNLDGELL